VFKGGYWGPVRARCRASTRVHNEDYAFYQQGFRCCASMGEGDARDAGGATPGVEVEPPLEDAAPVNQDMLQPP
jgi:hypothetical protein